MRRKGILDDEVGAVPQVFRQAPLVLRCMASKGAYGGAALPVIRLLSELEQCC